MKTPLYPVYASLEGVKIIDFGGWDLPVQFSTGISAEHKAVREKAGLFDVSHMGEITIQGEGSLEYLEALITGRLSDALPGDCRYSPMCYPDGGTVDDLIVYIKNRNDYLLVVNASNTEKDFKWITGDNPLASSRPGSVHITDISAQTAQIALQGPLSESILTPLTDKDTASLAYYRFLEQVTLGGKYSALVSRTGYTGEDGYEIYVSSEEACDVWNLLSESCEDLIPCGLGARDTLRLEVRFPLYGHELERDISPVEAGLKRFIDLEKKSFVGKEALSQQIESNSGRVLRGIRMIDRGVARQGYDVSFGSRVIGHITSGTKSPSRGDFIGLMLIERGVVKTGDTVLIDVHGRQKKAEVIKLPFL